MVEVRAHPKECNVASFPGTARPIAVESCKYPLSRRLLRFLLSSVVDDGAQEKGQVFNHEGGLGGGVPDTEKAAGGIKGC